MKFLTHEGALWVVRDMNHEMANCDMFKPIEWENVIIRVNSIIMTRITIGDNVIIGNGSVVTRSIHENSIVSGSPAKHILTLDKFFIPCKR